MVPWKQWSILHISRAEQNAILPYKVWYLYISIHCLNEWTTFHFSVHINLWKVYLYFRLLDEVYIIKTWQCRTPVVSADGVVNPHEAGNSDITYEEQLLSAILTASFWFSSSSPLQRILCLQVLTTVEHSTALWKQCVFLSLMFDSQPSHRLQHNRFTFYSALDGFD